ncbi:hypothetical protein WAF17_12590 [Bernardetia sp. ABR2-2B]|uniref:NACHT domain-containing protein n=1 Tax=Bernardetia sp. ABR2-2B TaxID=3127472 RepID=UPI0030D2DCD7
MKTNWQDIKEGIRKDIDNLFDDNVIDTFLEVLKISDRGNKSNNLAGIRRGLETRYIEEKFGKFPEALKDIVGDIEGFFRNLYELLTPNNIPTGTLGYLFNRFFDDIPLNSREVRNNFFTDPKHPNPKQKPTYFVNRISYGKELKTIYDLRNAFSHKKEEITYPTFVKKLNDIGSSYEDIKSVVIAYLAITEHYLNDLQDKIKEQNALDLSPYLKAVKENFITRFKKYVQIRSEEDLKLSRNIKERNIAIHEEEVEKRKGTIEELRKNGEVTEGKMLIWADAGMGKSTTLEYLAYTDAKRKLRDNSINLPIFLQMGLLTNTEKSLKQYMLKEIEKQVLVGEEYLENELKEGKINLFIDALNETPEYVKSKRMKEIEELLEQYPENFFILSSRSSDNPFRNMPVFILQRMNDDELDEFLLKNTKGLPEVAGKIKEAMNNDQNLKSILRQYFMFSKLIEIVKDTGKVPDGEGAIVYAFIQSLYDREYMEKKDDNFNERNRENIDRVLANLAYHILEEMIEGSSEKNPVFTKNKALNQFAEVKNKYGFSLDLPYVLDICNQLDILEKIEEKYRFSHSIYIGFFYTLQERIILDL